MVSAGTVEPGAGRTLADWTLPAHGRHLEVPRYDRSRLSPGVVHFGVGGFHRAHQAVYFDDLARNGCEDWGILGVSLRRPDARDALTPQDCLYTVVERSAQHDRGRVIGSLLRCLSAPEESEAVLTALADERTRLVTLTITADGYDIDPTTGALAADKAHVRAQLDDPTRPSTAYGYIVEALRRRRAAGCGPFTVLSCDNLPDNGAMTRAAVVGFARLRDPELAHWIDTRVTFPGSMVDRITPSVSDDDREMVGVRFGVADRAPVLTEPFTQWIIDDAFCNRRPPLDTIGARFVKDVTPYKHIKSRLLNGTHTALGPLGVLAGHRTIDQAMADPVFARYTQDLLALELAPLVADTPGVDLADYRATLLRRFANPKMGDRLARLCERGSTKLPGYLVPSVREALDQGRAHRLLTLSIAAWMRFYRGSDGRGAPIAVQDGMGDELRAKAMRMGEDPMPLLEYRAIFGELGAHQGFVAALRLALRDIDRFGVRGAVAAHVHAQQMRTAA